MRDIDYLDGHEFEKECAAILAAVGFSNVRVTPGSHDYGSDIICERDGRSYAIQCKRMSSNVGYRAVAEANAGKCYYKTDVGVVLTNRYFTNSAKEGAKRLEIELWDRDTLRKYINCAYRNETARQYATTERQKSATTERQKRILPIVWCIVVSVGIMVNVFRSCGSADNSTNSASEVSIEVKKTEEKTNDPPASRNNYVSKENQNVENSSTGFDKNTHTPTFEEVDYDSESGDEAEIAETQQPEKKFEEPDAGSEPVETQNEEPDAGSEPEEIQNTEPEEQIPTENDSNTEPASAIEDDNHAEVIAE